MEEKIYFQPGDLVEVKQGLDYKPKMIIVKKKTDVFRSKNSNEDEQFFKGMICRWFTKDGNLMEAVFNTKDLKKL